MLVGVIAVCYAAVELQQHGPSYANILDNDEDDAHQVKAPGMTVAWNPSGRSFDMTYESLQGIYIRLFAFRQDGDDEIAALMPRKKPIIG